MMTTEDYERLTKLMADYANSDEHKEYLIKKRIENDIKLNRYKQFEKYLEINDFDRLLYRLILEHGEDWCEKCYENGFEPYMNNKLKFLFEYITYSTETVTVKKLNSIFPNSIWEFNDYYFQIIYGQGVIIKIYNKEDMRELLCI